MKNPKEIKQMETDIRIKVFHFLDELRESGITNMFGATPYIQTEFGFSKNRARGYLTDWMTSKKKETDHA